MRKKPQIKSLTYRKYRQAATHNPTKTYIVYDLSIEDVNERKKQAKIYTSGAKLSQSLGLRADHIREYINPLLQKKYYCKAHEKYYAIRELAKRSPSAED